MDNQFLYTCTQYRGCIEYTYQNIKYSATFWSSRRKPVQEYFAQDFFCYYNGCAEVI